MGSSSSKKKSKEKKNPNEENQNNLKFNSSEDNIQINQEILGNNDLVNNPNNDNNNNLNLQEEKNGDENTKKNELKKKEEELNIKEKEINKREKEIDSKLEEGQKKINEKEQELNEKERKLNEKEKKLNEKENNILLRQSILGEKEKEDKINLNEVAMKELEKLKQENEEIKNKYLNLKKEAILVGLNNIGATCYMNATLQCLSNTALLTNYFLSEYQYEPNNNKKIMSNAYYNVIKDLWNRENHKKSISPNEFKEKLSQENPLFAGIAANDSKDLINFLIERFHNELNIIKNEKELQNINYNNSISQNENQLNEQKMLNIFMNEYKIKYNSIISKSFYGILETKSQCQICKNIKYNFQIYSFIEFPLERVNQYCFNNGKRMNYNMINNKNPDIDIYECFEYYNNIELMTGDNQMYCNICNLTYDSLYGSLLYSTPNYLIINLNRGRGAVYECKVIFPEQLNLFNFVSYKNGNTVYELYAVICHIGPNSMSGHFVAYCRNRIDKKWYLYNDGFVTLCQNLKDYQKGMVYILFYQTLKNYN